MIQKECERRESEIVIRTMRVATEENRQWSHVELAEELHA